MSEYRPPYPPQVNGPDIVGTRVAAPGPPGPADLFREMAERIERNDPAEFAGAILVVPPLPENRGEWEPIEILLINPNRDEPHFWSTVFRKVEMEAGKWADANSPPPPGRLR